MRTCLAHCCSAVAALAALLLVAVTTGCSTTVPVTVNATPTSGLQALQQRGEMRVGYLVWAPCVTRDAQTGELGGIYVDMVTHIAQTLNVKVRWQETTLATFAAGLDANQFDFCVGPSFITIPRATGVTFTAPVAYVGNSGVVRRTGKLHPTHISELNTAGLKIAVLKGQAMEEYCRAHAPLATLLVLPGADLSAPLAEVVAGRADIGMSNAVTALTYATAHPEVSLAFADVHEIEILPIAWSTRRNDPETAAFLNASIAYLKSTGRLTEYQRKYAIKLLYDLPTLAPADEAEK